MCCYAELSFMLSVANMSFYWLSFYECYYADCCYSECCYGDCYYAECRSTTSSPNGHFDGNSLWSSWRFSVLKGGGKPSKGATTLSITTLSIMTFSITTFSIMAECCYAECHYTKLVIMLNVTNNPFMLSVTMLNVIMPSIVAPFKGVRGLQWNKALFTDVKNCWSFKICLHWSSFLDENSSNRIFFRIFLAPFKIVVWYVPHYTCATWTPLLQWFQSWLCHFCSLSIEKVVHKTGAILYTFQEQPLLVSWKRSYCMIN
jgi:hypothetical protein